MPSSSSPKKRTSQKSYSTLGMGQHNLLEGRKGAKGQMTKPRKNKKE